MTDAGLFGDGPQREPGGSSAATVEGGLF